MRTAKIPSIPELERMAKNADFNPAKMASFCGISERHLQRIFKEHLGSSPAKWLRALQCRLAQALIIEGYSNKAVAAELSFSTDAHFCREFKKFFGLSPQKFAAHRTSFARLGE